MLRFNKSKKRLEDFFVKQVELIEETVDTLIENDDSTGRGRTSILTDGSFLVEISAPILFKPNIRLSSDSELQKQFHISELSLFHEVDHVETLSATYLKNEFDPKYTPALFGYAIRVGNQSIYNNNYFNMPQEVSAELNAIKTAVDATKELDIPEEVLKEALQERIEQGKKDFSSDKWFLEDYDLNNLDDLISKMKEKSKEIPKFLYVENLTKQNGLEEKEYDTVYQYFLDNKNSPIWEIKNKTGALVIPIELALSINLNHNKFPQIKLLRERIESGILPIDKDILNLEKTLRETVRYIKSPEAKELFEFAKQYTEKEKRIEKGKEPEIDLLDR